jgi:hypothetical protein
MLVYQRVMINHGAMGWKWMECVFSLHVALAVGEAQYLVTGSDSTKGATSRGGGKPPVDGKEAMYM